MSAREDHDVTRIHIIGGGGSGKTTLARRLASARGADHVELDVAADLRPPTSERGWVTEGIFLYGVEPLLDAAETIVWLDLPWRTARNRIVWRHVRLSAIGQNRHRGIRKLRDFLRSQRRYYIAGAREPLGPTDWDALTRASTEKLLTSYRDKVVHLRRSRDVDHWAAELRL